MAMLPSTVWPSRPRETVQVRFADGRTYESHPGVPLAQFVAAAYPSPGCPIVAALVNASLEELSVPVTADVNVVPIDTSSNDGMRIYHRSVSFLLVVAIHELFPQVHVVIDHSVAWGGYLCVLSGQSLFQQQDLDAIAARMQQIVAADEPIIKEHISVDEATRLFAAQGYDDKVHLLAYREQADISVYRLRGVYDYFYGYMLASTGKMSCFGLQLYPPGFVLRLPERSTPTTLPPARDFPKLNAVFREYGRWLNILGMEGVSELNEAVEHGHIRKTVLVSEALHEKHIAEIADAVIYSSPRRLVLIAGPSSSGKTTFARRLAIQLAVNGLKPFALGLDDYFVDRERTPHDEQGNYDFESLEAINIPLFNEHLLALLAGRSVRLPHYDFKAGRSTWGAEVSLPADAVVIVEGIHGLNPRLVADLPSEWVYRIYVSALTQLNIDQHNRVPTTDTRLIRRIVRDAQFRGYSARQTIERWESVRRGEERNIFPYQENADVMFNSALAYELAVLKPYAEPLLLRIPHDSLESLESRRLLAFLQWVRPCPADVVPDNSLLREFIGGSILEDFVF
jgi:uridine kinase